MSYFDEPAKKIEVRDDRRYENHDALIEKAGNAGSRGERTDAGADEIGYLGVDDLDRIRRKNLKHKTR